MIQLVISGSAGVHDLVVVEVEQSPRTEGGIGATRIGATAFGRSSTSQHTRRWLVAGFGDPPIEAQMDLGSTVDERQEMSGTSALVARTTSQAIRAHALNVVEEICGEIIQTEDAGEVVELARIGLSVVAGLRSHMATPGGDEHLEQWLGLARALAAFLPGEVVEFPAKFHRLIRAVQNVIERYEQPLTA